MKRSSVDGTIPEGWRMVRLGEVAEVNREQWDPSEGSTILYLDLTAVVAPGRLSPPNELAAEDAPSRARRRVKDGDVLVSTVRPYLRGFARVHEAPQNLIASTGFCVLTPLPTVDRSLIYHYVMASPFARHLEASMTGQAYPAVRPNDITSYRFPLPPLPEQRSIAAVLDSIDEAIERTDAVIAATEQLRDSLLHELLTRGVPGWHTEWKEAPGVGTIPTDWEVVRLGDVAEVNARSWNPAEGEHSILYLDLTAVVAPGVLTPPRNLAVTEAPSRARRRVITGDILISTVRPNLRGFARVTAASSNLIASTGFAVVTPKPIVSRSILYHYVMTDRFANYLEESTTGQAYPAVRAADVANFRFAAPPLPEQKTIAAVLDSVDDAIERARGERDRLQTMKESAADALLTGRVRAQFEVMRGQYEG